MPDIDPTLALRELVYYDERPFYIVGHKIVYTALGNKTTYQIAQDLPNAYGVGRGTYPNELYSFDREEIMSQVEFDSFKLETLEAEANSYELTLTGLPIITLNSSHEINYVFDGTNSYPWDGESYPPYDPLVALPLNTIWFDQGGHVTDQEDLGHAGDNIIAHHIADISWDGNSYSIDNLEFNLSVVVTHTINEITTIVPDVNLSILGVYEVTYEVFDSQRIHSYPITRTINVHDIPVRPSPNC